MHRRSWLGAAAIGLTCMCTARQDYPRAPAGTASDVSFVSLAEFPFEESRSHELSGLTWDPTHATLYAISDKGPRIVPLKPSADFKSWTFGEEITVHAPAIAKWDGEGIALTPNGFFAANERPPSLFEMSRTGELRAILPIPPHFGRCRPNRCFESLSLTPDGRSLFTANEAPIEDDGAEATADAPALIRILRTDLATMKQTEFAYVTDRVVGRGRGGELGVSEMVALSAEDVLVLERSFVPPAELGVRIYRADLRGAVDVTEKAELTTALAVPKDLVFDVGSLESEPANKNGYRFLSNYEGMCLGPTLDGDRRLLFLVSDDNARREQTRRLLTLALRIPP